jgi:CxxC motif-containing protein
MDCMGEIAGHHIKGEVQMGEAVIRDILGLGVDIVACRTIPYGF